MLVQSKKLMMRVFPYVFLVSLVFFMYFFKSDEVLTNQEQEHINSELYEEQEESDLSSGTE
ncbi:MULTISPECIES: hypothetical protein [Sinobaca]|uniref:Uncharacterized protein n=1 Tax=Sinobaca qinghaiensis TaxID=342944 RepID=A0A419UX96_9BACL|nr:MULTISPECIES: hypothetical protein [Sinobaca]RKD69763.1 hypothetical protein ATL39_3190 [Sinobaca qinghaiensis]